ncbi:MAG: hypothetical protein D8M52_06025 [Chlorobi bacterium]|nr:MAG: hypothetical protein F9K28_03270 [Bacteroidota bacterium]KXK35596.1 MAG: hypothetical protein UZ06_CHB003000329 [Chlorobi bacterium OLB6]MBE2266484.1 hypothetical protein [Flavobacteriales bacterium]MBL1161261.1 hypothetical protein [Chlorobiota bacterium]MBW7854297.1 hypothetical protein [Candidatus Kapabacteria bacterium]MCC6332041.1 hypothetical protein [Ignavibacteria bacterium]
MKANYRNAYLLLLRCSCIIAVFWFTAYANCSAMDTLWVGTIYTTPPDKVQITEAVSVSDYWLLGYGDGKISWLNKVTGTEQIITVLPQQRGPRKILFWESKRAIVALCADGSLFFIDSSRQVTRIGNSTSYGDVDIQDQGLLVCNAGGIAFVDVETNTSTVLFSVTPSLPVQCLALAEDSIVVVTNIGTAFWMARVNDVWKATDTTVLGIAGARWMEKIGSAILVGNRDTLVTLHNADDVRPVTFDLIRTDFPTYPPKIVLTDIVAGPAGATLLVKAYTYNMTIFPVYILHYDAVADSLSNITGNARYDYTNSQVVGIDSNLVLVGGTDGYLISYQGDNKVLHRPRRSTFSSDWSDFWINASTVYATKTYSDGTFSVGVSEGGKNWGLYKDYSFYSDISKVLGLFTTDSGFMVLTNVAPVFVNTADSVAKRCDFVPPGTFVSCTYAGTRPRLWVNQSNSVGYMTNNECVFVEAKSPGFLNTPLYPLSDGSVVFRTLTGGIYTAGITNDSIEFKQHIIELKSDEFASLWGSAGDDFVVAKVSKQTLQLRALVFISPAGSVSAEYDFQWANQLSANSVLVINDDRIVCLRSDTLSIIHPRSQQVFSKVIKLTDVDFYPDLKVLGIIDGEIVLSVNRYRLAFIPESVTSVDDDYPVRHVFIQSCYPNPVDEFLHVDLGRNVTADLGNTSVYLVNMLGQVQPGTAQNLKWDSNGFKQQIMIPVGGLSPGVYCLVVQNRGYAESRLVQVTAP